ncbi:MAG: hypothetical protein WCN98_20840, partial [Verrucomicrobiaceae bacterium]
QPDRAAVHNHAGSVLLRMGRMESAKIHFEKALAADPPEPETLNSLAWILATSPDPYMRNGPRAMMLARKAGSQLENRNPEMLKTLAAALAECSRFSEAAQTAGVALEMASSMGDLSLADNIRKQLENYMTREPFRDHQVPEPDDDAGQH